MIWSITAARRGAEPKAWVFVALLEHYFVGAAFYLEEPCVQPQNGTRTLYCRCLW